jgi:hypothetical protein
MCIVLIRIEFEETAYTVNEETGVQEVCVRVFELSESVSLEAEITAVIATRSETASMYIRLSLSVVESSCLSASCMVLFNIIDDYMPALCCRYKLAILYQEMQFPQGKINGPIKYKWKRTKIPCGQLKAPS